MNNSSDRTNPSLPIRGEASRKNLVDVHQETTLFVSEQVSLSINLGFRMGRGSGLTPSYRVVDSGVSILSTSVLDEAIREYNIRCSIGSGPMLYGFPEQRFRTKKDPSKPEEDRSKCFQFKPGFSEESDDQI
jgi:hypothetical protein